MITEGLKRGVSLEKIVELLSVNPAKLFHIFPQKGTISAGADGDLVIVDMNKKVTCHAEDSYSQAKGIMKVYEGWQLDCAVDSTIVRGRVVYENGKVAGTYFPCGIGFASLVIIISPLTLYILQIRPAVSSRLF